MEKEFSTSWKGSTQPRKQRKFRYNAPLHIKQSFLGVHLSKELRTKYNTRSLQVRKGDKVVVVRGQYKKRSGKVERVEVKNGRVFLAGIEITKKDGSKNLIPLQPSNLMITEIATNDKKRQQLIERKSGKSTSSGKKSTEKVAAPKKAPVATKKKEQDKKAPVKKETKNDKKSS